MIRTAFLLVLALCGRAVAQAPAPATQNSPPEAVMSLDDFSKCGYVSRFSPNKIDPQCFQGLNNAVLDQDLSILRRNGYATYTNSPCAGLQSVRGEWPFYATDGSQYLIVQSSVSMYSSKGDGTCTTIAGLTNLSPTAQMSCVQGMGQLWCTDGIDSVFETNVTSTATVTQAPLGKYIGFFRNRIMISGVSGFLTQIYLSGELNGTDYTLPTVTYSTSPAILNISGTNDGQAVSCLMGEYQNGYYIGRQYDTYLLSGYDLRDFGISKVDQQIGCMDNNSPRMVNNTLMWLSHRGIESLTGTQINWVSYPIDPDIKVIINAAGNSQAFTVSGTNFTQGNLTASGAGAPISATIYPGNLTVSSATYVDNSIASFITGTLVNVSTRGTSMGLSISTNAVGDSGITSSSFWKTSSVNPSQAGFVTNGQNITSTCGTEAISCPFGEATCGYITGTLGCGGCGSVGVTLTLYDGATGNILYETSDSPGGTNNTSKSFSHYIQNVETSTSIYACFGQYDGGKSPFSFYCDNATTGKIRESPTTPAGFTITYDVFEGCHNSGFFEGYASVSNVKISSYVPSGSYTSAAFNTTFSTPTLGTINVSVSSNSVGAITLQQENSTDGISWSSPSSFSQGAQGLNGKQYWRYIETFTTTNGTTTPTSSGIPSLAAETTAYYLTPCVNTTGMTTYGVFSVNAVTNGGSFTFWTSTGATCAAVGYSTDTWTAQTANAIITASTANYIAARVLFSIDTATQVPILNNIGFNWNAGASRPPVASAQYLNKYFLFYTTSQVSGAVNDHAVVFDQNAHWQLMDDVHAASAALYLNQLFLGDSNATGNIYLFDSGNDDAGGAFTFSFKTPDMDGGDPISLKSFKRAYLILGAPSQTTLSGSFACSYSLSGSPTTYSLGTVNLTEAPEQGGYWVAKLPFPTASPTMGQWVNLSCSNTGTQGPFRVYGVRIVYVKNDWP